MRKKIKSIGAVLFAFAMVVGLCACSESGKESDITNNNSSEGDSITLALCVKTITNDDFMLKMDTAMSAFCEENGYEYVLGVGGAQGAVTEQVHAFEDLVQQGVDGIVCSASDANALVPAYQAAKEAGIPVMSIDSNIAEGYEDLYYGYFGNDDYSSAKQSGEKLREYLDENTDGTGTVLIVKGSSGSQSSENRGDGFAAAFEDSGYNVVSEYGDWDSNVAMGVVTNAINANGDLVGICTASGVMYPGILSALQDAGKEDVIKVAAHDGFKVTIEGIEKGIVICDAITQPGEEAVAAAKAIVDVIETGKCDVPDDKFVNVGVKLTTIDNLEENKDYFY